MLWGKGLTTGTLTVEDVRELLAQASDTLSIDGKRVLVLIPDGTRHAPIPLLFRLLYEHLGKRVARLDYLIALGTHPPMPAEAVDRLVGVPAEERAQRFPDGRIFNHAWDRPDALAEVGRIPAAEVETLTG